MRKCAFAPCNVRSCWNGAWRQMSVPTAACSARKEVMRHGCLTKRDDRKSDRFASDERKAGRKDRGRKRPCPSHKCPQCGHFQGFVTGDRGTLLSGVCTLWNAPSSSFLSVFKGFRRRSTGPKPYFGPNFGPILRSKLAEEFNSYFRKSVVVVCVAKRDLSQRK